jgi:hypothetical protein
MIKKVKGVFEIGEIHSYNIFEHFWLKSGFGPKIIIFEDVSLTKVIHFRVTKTMDA